MKSKSRVAPHTKILRAGVIAALEQGEATTVEIAQRMGVTFGGDKMVHHLRTMERRGAVKEIAGHTRAKRWALPS